MRVMSVPCLKDNYAYLVIDDETNQMAIVDPGEAGPCEIAIANAGAKLVAIWATHHHPDHVDGIKALVAANPDLVVVGHASDRERLPQITHAVEDGDTVTLGGVTAKIIHNPGHTLGAISYWIEQDSAVFTGDTLFGAGCGRMFEGTPSQMIDSLLRLAALPDETGVYFGHEYTASNLKFAATVEPGSKAIVGRIETVTAAREAGHPTTPSTMAEERQTNPFLRVAAPPVVKAVRARNVAIDPYDHAAIFGALRSWKDTF